jgi:quinol monooxygenase YgiN
MPSAETLVLFDRLQVERPSLTAALAADVTELLAPLVPPTPVGGPPASVRVHLDESSGIVVVRGVWALPTVGAISWDGYPGVQVLNAVASDSRVKSSSRFVGAQAPGLTGPQWGRPPGIVAVATRHLAGPQAAATLLDLLARSGEWKRDFPGFIAATPYLSADRRTFINYAQWVDESAYQAWMADPRIGEGQREIAGLEVAAPEYLLCRLSAELAGGPA